MKKFIILIVVLTLILILGMLLVCLGTNEVNEELCISIGTGFITSAVVSIFLEIIAYVNERRLLNKASKLFFKQYKKAFFDLRDDLPRLYDRTSFDGRNLNFSEYMDSLFDAALDENTDTDEVLIEIEIHIEKIKSTLEVLISLEKDVFDNEVIYSKFNLIKQQLGSCKRLLGSIKIGAYEKAKIYATKLKDNHLKMFPDLKEAFESVYRDD